MGRNSGHLDWNVNMGFEFRLEHLYLLAFGAHAMHTQNSTCIRIPRAWPLVKQKELPCSCENTIGNPPCIGLGCEIHMVDRFAM